MGGQAVKEGTKMGSENSEFQAMVCASGRERTGIRKSDWVVLKVQCSS